MPREAHAAANGQQGLADGMAAADLFMKRQAMHTALGTNGDVTPAAWKRSRAL